MYEIFVSPVTPKYSIYLLNYVYTGIRKNAVCSYNINAISILNEFSRSQAVTYAAKLVIGLSAKRCIAVTYLH